jgi:hypothetical protein
VLCICDLDKEDGSFHSHEDAFDGHNGFDRKELGKELEKAGFNKVRFTTCYTLMKDGRPYPLFLSVAEKK